jgi:SAM-dependent methyltransferase
VAHHLLRRGLPLIYQPQITEERNRQEVDFLRQALDLPPDTQLLDLACGTGRHAIGMAKAGYQVTGFDFNSHYLEIAARNAEQEGVAVRWMVGDMRELEFDGAFDGVYSFFTSFGYFSDAENEGVVERLVRALRPGGRFLIDMANRDWLLIHRQQRTWTQQRDGGLLMEEATSRHRHFTRHPSRMTLIPPRAEVPTSTKEFLLRLYTCAEADRLVRAPTACASSAAWGAAERAAIYFTPRAAA